MSTTRPPHILWIATKAPWPPVDGGRLLLWNTLEELAWREVRVSLLAPDLGMGPEERDATTKALADVCQPLLVPARLNPRPIDGLQSLALWRPWTMQRHRHRALRRQVSRLIASGDVDLIQVEQVQAMSQIPTDLARRVARRTTTATPMPPLVLRAQNVESDLWRALGEHTSTPAPLRLWLRREARLLADAEVAAVRRADATLALTPDDRLRLGELAGTPDRVHRLAAPFKGNLEPGPALDGSPAVVVFGSAGWAPNADGARFFLREVWPVLRERAPAAVLHLFGDLGMSEAGVVDGMWAGVRRHPSPRQSAQALAADSVLVVPLFVASGVRMKILEAWARGVPVVATSAAARGLDLPEDHDAAWLVADEPTAMAEAVVRAHAQRQDLIRAGRAVLDRHHRPMRMVDRLLEIYASLGVATAEPSSAPSSPPASGRADASTES